MRRTDTADKARTELLLVRFMRMVLGPGVGAFCFACLADVSISYLLTLSVRPPVAADERFGRVMPRNVTRRQSAFMLAVRRIVCPRSSRTVILFVQEAKLADEFWEQILPRCECCLCAAIRRLLSHCDE
jgi:hypothetical protein